MKKVLMFATVFVLFCSCTSRLVDFTVISTKNVPIGDGVANIQKANTRVEGVDKKHTILFIPLGFPNLKTAIDKAIESYPGAIGLADGVVKSKWWHALLYGQNAYIVEGTPIYEADGASNSTKAKNQSNTQSETLLFFHEVKDGETLADIAKIYNVTVGDIIRWNSLSTTNIKKGDKLKVQVK